LLWAIQQRVEKRRLRLAFKYPFRRILKNPCPGCQDLAGYLVDEYAKVLTKNELKSFSASMKGSAGAAH
jgi:hypothetical protein